MSKAVRINVLVITIVVTLFVFAGLWFMRPGVPNEILEQARQRQSVPLMEVQPPVKKPSVQDVSNTLALAKELLPTLKQELEGPLAQSIRSQLLADQALAFELSKSVQPLLAEVLQSQLGNFRQEMEQSMLSNLQALRENLQADAVANGNQIQSVMSEAIASNKAELLSLLPQLVDAKIPQVVEQVVAQLEANKESYLASLRESIAPALEESDLIALYDTYRNQIVLDLVPALLDEMETTVREEVNAYVASMPLVRVPAAPSVKRPSIQVQAQSETAPVAPVVEIAPEVVTSPSEMETAPIILQEEPAEPIAEPVPVPSAPSVAPAVVQPAEPIPSAPVPALVLVQPAAPSIPKTVQTTVTVEAPPVPKQGQPIITVPVFEEKEKVVFLAPEEYERQRQEIRNKAIEDVLKRIAP
ncbi:MAG: hypothetical protein RBU26_04055 [Sphaerochaeta sp.]|jgi:hypothetical protein|uniref:hypothetical protein n=1 Tax=Sphaerochaeta sp. TaxID=1972642 RepID=UPI002A35E35C|nr:hypothetical protein [Sphaerochaeta sp.]MDX9824095.1 hypothetical protein [Sphaerochaeta sp.]